MTVRTIGSWLGAALLAITLGCGGDDKSAGGGGTAKPDDHAHADTVDGLVHELMGFRDTIRDSFAADKPEDAHDPIHEVHHVLELIEKKLDTIPETHRGEAKASVEALFDLFGQVDKKMHNPEEGVEYSEVSDAVDAGIEVLHEAAEAEEGDDHKDGDHKDGDKDGDKDGHDDAHKDAAKDAVKDAAKDATDAAKDVKDAAKDAVKDAAKDATDAAKDAVKDAVKDATDAAKDATDAAKDAVKDIKDAAKPGA